MNTGNKGAVTLECERCTRNYMRVGDVAIRLSQHRPANFGPDGMPYHGVCPDHRRDLFGEVFHGSS